MQRGELGQIAHQAERAAYFHIRSRRKGEVRVGARNCSYAAVDGRNGYAQAADFAVGGHVFHFAALNGFSIAQASGEHSGEIRICAEYFLVRAVTQGSYSQRFFRRRIRGTDRSGGVHQKQARGHIARDFFR